MQTVDLIANIAASLERVVDITSTSVVSGVMTVSTANTYWLNKGSKVTIDATIYEVLGVTYNTSFTITASSIVGATYLLAAPRYIHGKQKKVNSERGGVDAQMDKDKCPFVWLVEPYKEVKQDWVNIVDRKADLVVIFLDHANYDDWTTNEHYTDVIIPMDSLKVEFFKEVVNSRLFSDLETVTEMRQVIFGTKDEKGSTQSILDETLSGIETRFTLNILKQYCQ